MSEILVCVASIELQLTLFQAVLCNEYLEKRWPTLECPEEWCLNILIKNYPDMEFKEVKTASFCSLIAGALQRLRL